MEEGLWVCVCSHILSSVPSSSPLQGPKPNHPPAGQTSLLWTLSGSLSPYKEKDTKRWKYEGMWRRRSGIRKQEKWGCWLSGAEEVEWDDRWSAKREREEERGGGIKRREEEERESQCRAQSSLFSLTKNSSSSGNPVPQDMTIWIKASITSHNA